MSPKANYIWTSFELVMVIHRSSNGHEMDSKCALGLDVCVDITESGPWSHKQNRLLWQSQERDSLAVSQALNWRTFFN